MRLSEFSLRWPVTAAMITLAILVLGILAFDRLPVEQSPSVVGTGVMIRAAVEPSTPLEVERTVTRPLERALVTVGDFERVRSWSRGNEARVYVDLKPGTDVPLARAQIRDRVDYALALMPDADKIKHLNVYHWWSDRKPIINARFAWHGESDHLLDIVRKVIEPRILRIEGVGYVLIGSIQYKQLNVDLDRQQLRAHGMTMAELDWQLRENNVNMSLGRVKDGGKRFDARLVSQFVDPERIGDLPLLGQNGLQLGDIADIDYGYPPRQRYERLDGEDSIEFMVHRMPTASLLDVGGAVLDEIARFEEEFDGLLEVGIVRDHASRVRREAGKLVDTASLGVVLAMAVIFLFMRNIRSTLVVGTAIPISTLCVFIGLFVAREAFGSTVTLNMVTMVGLMLAIGMLADPAVVVLDSIFRHREEGADANTAALKGGREVGMAVFASCVTTTCVFVPFFFLSDSWSAAWMRDAGIAICLAVIASTLVALVLLPLLASRLFAPGIERYDRHIKAFLLAALLVLVACKAHAAGLKHLTIAWERWCGLVGDSIAGMMWTTAAGFLISPVALGALSLYIARHGLRPSYARLLSWTLDHRWAVLAATAVLTATGYHLYSNIEHRGLPWERERHVIIVLNIDRSYSLEEVREHFLEIERILLPRKKELDIESLVTDFSHGGGRVEAYLVDPDEGHLTTNLVQEAILALLPKKVGIIQKPGYRPSDRTYGTGVELYGRDPEMLDVLLDEVSSELLKMPGVKWVTTSLEDGKEEVHVAVDRAKAVSHGVSAREVATGINAALGPWRSSTFKDADREIDIYLQLKDPANLDQLRTSTLAGNDGQSIQLGSLANFRVGAGPRTLRRVDRRLRVSVFATTATQEEANALDDPIAQMVNSIELPPGYSWETARTTSWAREAAEDSNYMVLFAALLIYLILASLFESVAYPFTIMLAIPFSLIGVALGLSAFGINFDENGALGLLILFGIVVNNGIVLISHINQLRAQGMSRRDAILLGGERRLRPILITAATTILNLMPIVIPMAYGAAEGFARRWGPTSLVVVSGLATSTLLSLVLAPMLYSLLDDLVLWLKQRVRG